MSSITSVYIAIQQLTIINTHQTDNVIGPEKMGQVSQ